MLNRFTFLSAAVLLNLVACSGDEEAGDQWTPKEAYPKYTDSTTATYVINEPNGNKTALSAMPVGKITVANAEYTKYEVRDPKDAAGEGVEIWANVKEDNTVELAGGVWTKPADVDYPVPDYISTTADAPYILKIDVPVGEPQPFAVSGSSIVGSPTDESKPGSIEGTYTLVEKDVTVETPTGTVSGVSHYTVKTALPVVLGVDAAVEGDVYFHPELGVVKADLARPFSGLGVGFAGSQDITALGDGFYSVQKVATLGQGFETSSRLTTYDLTGEFDADKNTHAKMLMEVRWVDEARAKTDERPEVISEFGTVFGIFPALMVPLPVSFFYPDEEGKGYKYWMSYVDQAAKNEAEQGISYAISADYDGANAVRVTKRIVFKRLE